MIPPQYILLRKAFFKIKFVKILKTQNFFKKNELTNNEPNRSFIHCKQLFIYFFKTQKKMRKDHVFMLDTLRALGVFFENYGDVVEKSPLLKEDVTDYNSIVEDIESKVDPDNAPITISTATKINLRNKVTQSLTNGLAKINAQAIKTGDEDLEIGRAHV